MFLRILANSSCISGDIFARKAVRARETEYIPEGDEMIAYTKFIGGGESVTITFDAPQQGIYNFICTFPAHYQYTNQEIENLINLAKENDLIPITTEKDKSRIAVPLKEKIEYLQIKIEIDNQDKLINKILDL